MGEEPACCWLRRRAFGDDYDEEICSPLSLKCCRSILSNFTFSTYVSYSCEGIVIQLSYSNEFADSSVQLEIIIAIRNNQAYSKSPSYSIRVPNIL